MLPSSRVSALKAPLKTEERGGFIINGSQHERAGKWDTGQGTTSPSGKEVAEGRVSLVSILPAVHHDLKQLMRSQLSLGCTEPGDD